MRTAGDCLFRWVIGVVFIASMYNAGLIGVTVAVGATLLLLFSVILYGIGED